MKKLIFILLLFTMGCSLHFKEIENPDELVTLSEMKNIKADTALYKVSVKGVKVRLYSKDNVFVKESQPNDFPIMTVHAVILIPLIVFSLIACALILDRIID